MRKARPLYAGEDLGLEMENSVYALDSTTVDLSLTLFPWADFRRAKAGIKLHTQIDLRGPIPTCIFITGARQHDVLWLDELIFEAGARHEASSGSTNWFDGGYAPPNPAPLAAAGVRGEISRACLRQEQKIMQRNFNFFLA